MAKKDGIGGTSGEIGQLAAVGNILALNGQSFSPTTDLATGQVNLSFLEEDEKPKAVNMIDDLFVKLCGKPLSPNFRLTRYFVAVRIYVRPEELREVTREDGTKGTLYLPDTVRAEDRYQSCTGMVVAIGPQAFQDKDGKPRGQKYNVGDFLLFPRTDIIRVDFCGVPLGIMTDDRAIAVIPEPADWAQGSLTFRG